MLGLIVALQRAFDGLGGRLATHVPHCSECLGVTFAGNDGANNLHTRHAGHVSHDVVQLQVHERQRLLHVLDVGSRVVQVPLAQAKIGAQRSDLAIGSEARAQ